MDVRTIIVEACARVNLVPRRQAVPGDIMENAYRLLRGIVSKYNNDSLLVWTQKSIVVPKANLVHIYDQTDVLEGQNNLYFDTVEELNAYSPTRQDYENHVWGMVKTDTNTVYTVISPLNDVYVWVSHEANNTQRVQEMQEYCKMLHMQVRDVARINSIYVVSDTNQPYKEFYNLEYVNHTEFDKYSNTSRVFTYTQKSEGEWLIQLKPYYLERNHRIKINYNESIQFDIDSDLFIPDSYIELLIVALAHKLALQYPRLDEAQMNRLEKEVQVLVDNVRTPKIEDRILTREEYFEDYGRMTQADLMSGRYLF